MVCSPGALILPDFPDDISKYCMPVSWKGKLYKCNLNARSQSNFDSVVLLHFDFEWNCMDSICRAWALLIEHGLHLFERCASPSQTMNLWNTMLEMDVKHLQWLRELVED